MNSKSNIIILLLFVYKISAQWDVSSSINTPVSTAILDQQEVRLVSDGVGGAFIAWEDFRSNISFADIFVQRVDKNGYAKWTPNGINICSNILDQRNVSISQSNNSSAIISWSDARNGNLDIYAQKVDSIGYTQWASNGVPVCIKALSQQDVKSVPDQNGGAYFVWTDSLAGFYDLYAQHLDANGNQLFPANGLPVCTALDKQINAKIEVDGSGGCIITWMDKRFGDYDIYAQRIDASGNTMWTNNGVLVSSFPGNQSNPKIEPDGSGGAVIAWQDNRNSNDYDVYAQRINSSGIPQWNVGGVGVCTLAGSSQSAVEISTKGGINGAIIAWKDGRVGGGATQVYMQMLNPSGIAQWANNGILIGNGINPNLCEDGNGGVIVTWQESNSIDWNVMAQRVDGSGNTVWTSGGEKVGSASNDQISPKNVYDGNGGSIFAFQDKRNLADFDIYAHHFNSNGSPVGITENSNSIISSSCYPNPVNESTIIVFNTPRNIWKLKVYDNLGNGVYQAEISGSKQHKISKQFIEGIYHYVVTDFDGKVSSGSFVSE